jgi:predicted dehydrogenase
MSPGGAERTVTASRSDRRPRSRTKLGIGLIGFGWLGQAHSRSLLRIPTLFPDRIFDASLVICSDTDPARVDLALHSFGYRRGTHDWRAVMDHADVDVVFIAAPSMLHLALVEAAAGAGKDVFCEKPVGGTPEQTAQAERAARAAGVITGVGYNYRWAPLVIYARKLIAEHRLGEITNYRGRFLADYASDPLAVLSWRFRAEEGGYGASTDQLSHAVDLAQMLVGRITRVVGAMATFIPERPLAREAPATQFGRGTLADPRGAVTNEDYVAMLCEFENGACGTFEASRTIVGPETQMAFDIHGTKGAIGWNFERMNELALYAVSDEPHSGYTTVLSGERFPHHHAFAPGKATAIGYEDLVATEDYHFCTAVAERRQYVPGFQEALATVSVQAALLESCRTGGWQEVVSLRED